MSMVFAGFMSALQDDMDKKVERKHENKLKQDAFDHDAAMVERRGEIAREQSEFDAGLQRDKFNYEFFAEQRKKDAELGRKVDTVMSSLGLPDSARGRIASLVETTDSETVIEMGVNGQLDNLRFSTSGGSGGGGGDAANANTAPQVTGTQIERARKFQPVFAEKTYEYGLPSDYLMTTAKIESSFDPSAKNPSSSASGLFQFVTGTAAGYGVDVFDWQSSTDGAARLASDNGNTLSRALGRQATGAELYLAHQQGAGGALKLLKNPNGSAVSSVGADAVRNNGGSLDMTNSEFASIWLDKYDRVKSALERYNIFPTSEDAQTRDALAVNEAGSTPFASSIDSSPDQAAQEPQEPQDSDTGRPALSFGLDREEGAQEPAQPRFSSRNPRTALTEGSASATSTGSQGWISPKRLNISDYEGSDSTKLAQVLTNPRLRPDERDRLTVMYDIARRDETRGEPLTDKEIGAMDEQELQIRYELAEPGSEDQSRFGTALETFKTTTDDVAEQLSGLKNLNDVQSYRFSLKYRSDLPLAVKDTLRQDLDLREREIFRSEAIQRANEGKGLFVHRFNPETGLLDPTRIPVSIAEGGYKSLDSGEFLDSSEVEPVAEGGWEQAEKIYNKPIIEMGEFLATGASAVRAVLDYKRVAHNNPQDLNPFLQLAGNVSKTAINAIEATRLIGDALSGAVERNEIPTNKEGRIDYEAAQSWLSKVKGLSDAQRIIAQARLNAAYEMAAFRGSTGMGLSDRELAQNLASLGEGETDPKIIDEMADRALIGLVSKVETKRKSLINNTFRQDQIANRLGPNAPVMQDFKVYLESELGEYQQDYQTAMSRDLGPSVTKDETDDGAGIMSPDTPDETPEVMDVTGMDPQEAYGIWEGGQAVRVSPEMAERWPELRNKVGQIMYPRSAPQE